ncbi:RNA polymerase sigma factor [Streptomyces hoynatensis]|nr:sigma-70 family RNA polymerase sigma factor [Streptomyces hoynatensis]
MAEVGDDALLARARSGEDAAFAELYRRHAAAVRSHARLCCRDPHTAEDLAAEVFARTLRALRAGAGPRDSARAYLLTTVRRLAAQWSTGRGAAEQPVADVGERAEQCASEAQALSRADQSMAARAFHRLPDRWQEVLWHTAVEEEPLSEVAPLLGLSANAAAVLAFRAREGLREAYLQEHVNASLAGEANCREHAGLLGAYARKPSRRRGFQRLRRHLDSCDRCRSAYVELLDLNSTMRGLLPATLPVAAVGWFTAARLADSAPLAVPGVGLGAGAGAGAGAGIGVGAGAGGALGKLAVGATLALATGAVVTGSAPLTLHQAPEAPPAVSGAPQPPAGGAEGGGNLVDPVASPSRGPGRPATTAAAEGQESVEGGGTDAAGAGTGQPEGESGGGSGGGNGRGAQAAEEAQGQGGQGQGGQGQSETAQTEAAEGAAAQGNQGAENGNQGAENGNQGAENGNQGAGQGDPGVGNQGQGQGNGGGNGAGTGNQDRGNGNQGNGNQGNGNQERGNGNQGAGSQGRQPAHGIAANPEEAAPAPVPAADAGGAADAGAGPGAREGAGEGAGEEGPG